MIGWIANRIDPHMQEIEANIDTLRMRIDAPLLGVLDHIADGDTTLRNTTALDTSALQR